MSWKRPDSIPYPTIWRTFESRSNVGSATNRYWIQDLTEDYYDEVLQHMSTGFVRKSPICIYTNFIEDEESIQDYIKAWKVMFDLKLSIICLTDDASSGKKLVGCNILGRRYKGENRNLKEVYKGRASSIAGIALDYVYRNIKDVFAELEIDEYLSAFGLYVLPGYRGEGIGYQLLKTREKICLEVGMNATVTAFTTVAGQKLAEKLGFIDLLEISYKNLKKMDHRFQFPGIENGESKTVRLMYKIYR